MQEKDVDDQYNPPLINFDKWAHLKERAISASQYRNVPFTFDERDIQAAMAYLMKALEGIRVGEDFSRDLQKNSEKLAKNENKTRVQWGDVEAATKRAGFG